MQTSKLFCVFSCDILFAYILFLSACFCFLTTLQLHMFIMVLEG